MSTLELIGVMVVQSGRDRRGRTVDKATWSSGKGCRHRT
jgi:hypothetical protein